MVTVTEIGEFWVIACQDAGYHPEDDAALYVVPGIPSQGASAVHTEPGSPVGAATNWPLAPNQVQHANSLEKRDLHRIFVRDFESPRVALGRLRHELEHARQYDRSAEVYRYMSFTRDALSREFEQSKPPTLCGSGTLYNVLPFEEDANRAAARLTTGHFGQASLVELESTDAPLFRDQGVIDPDSLALRVLAAAALFPDGVSWVARQREETVDELVAHLGTEAPAAWSLLKERPEIAAFGKAALEMCPSEADLEATSSPAAPWTLAKQQIQLGRSAAESILKSEMPKLRLN